jgi:putative endonuclease
MAHIHHFGRESETQALTWYLAQGNYHLLVQNYRCRWGEIDLIFEERKPLLKQVELVFVEVRSRAHNRGWNGAESLRAKKQKRLRTTAEHFLSHYSGQATELRFDLVYWDGSQWNQLKNFWFDPNANY